MLNTYTKKDSTKANMLDADQERKTIQILQELAVPISKTVLSRGVLLIRIESQRWRTNSFMSPVRYVIDIEHYVAAVSANKAKAVKEALRDANIPLANLDDIGILEGEWDCQTSIQSF